MDKEVVLKKKEIRKKLFLAKTYLADSRNALKNSGLRLAADGAYNAAELVMKAAIILKGGDVPRRHGGIAQLFSLLYIKEGQLEKRFGGAISDGLEFRNKARYDEEAEITAEHAEHSIILAEELIEFLEKELAKASGSPGW